MNLKSTKFALILGVINGFVFYLAYQLIKFWYVKYLWHIKNDNYVYLTLPEIYRIASVVGEIFVWILLFMLASYTVHRFWASRLKTTNVLWLCIAVVALAVPIMGLWFSHFSFFLIILGLKQLGICFLPMNCGMPLEKILIRESVDIKFELLLFIVALLINLIYSAVIAKLSKSLKNGTFETREIGS